MKKIVLSEDVEFALRTLDPAGVRRVKSWFTYLWLTWLQPTPA